MHTLSSLTSSATSPMVDENPSLSALLPLDGSVTLNRNQPPTAPAARQSQHSNEVATAETRAYPYPVRLRQVDFWNQPNPLHERALLEHWASEGVLDLVQAARSDSQPFWLLDGPPYANGDAHLGHLLNKTLKDVTVRYHSLMNHRPVWRAGWDCHGLPLELATEKKQGPKAKEDRLGFMKACRAEAHHWQSVQSNDMQQLGLSADFKDPWLTMNPVRESKSLGLLRELWEAGVLVERHSPTHWCPACQSALAASELEKGEPQSRLESLFLAPLDASSSKALVSHLDPTGSVLPAALLENLGLVHVMSWTTTPWTLWANAGFAHPQTGTGVLAPLQDGRWALMGQKALENLHKSHPSLFDEKALEDDRLYSFSFEDLPALKLVALNPLHQQASPLHPAAFAQESEGSGFVHLAPAFGADDFEMGETYSLRMTRHVGPNGRLQGDDLPHSLQGLLLPEASAQSEALLKEKHLWLAAPQGAPYEPQLCWRHKKPVFYRASRQWALDLDHPFEGAPQGLRGRALASLKQVTFLPDTRSYDELMTMLQTRRFWTLSRDRLWGLPLPFFRNAQGELHPETLELWKQAEKLVAEGGVEAFEAMPAPEGYTKENQTVDVWFDSGAAFWSAQEEGLESADYVVEGRDQTRGWFLSSCLLAAFKSDKAPFKTVLTHGFVVDEKGYKLSKSKGGGPDHKVLLETYGSDALRLWASSQAVGGEVSWSKKALEQSHKELKDWRVFLRFMLANSPEENMAQPALLPLDELALHKAHETMLSWKDAMASGRYHLALKALLQFRSWASSEWFDLSKSCLYCAAEGSPSLSSVQWSLQTVLNLFLQMLSPFVPLSCEEAFLSRSAPQELSLFVLPFDALSSDFSSLSTEAAALEQALLWRRETLPTAEKARTEFGKAPLHLVFEAVPNAFEKKLQDFFPGFLVSLYAEGLPLCAQAFSSSPPQEENDALEKGSALPPLHAEASDPQSSGVFKAQTSEGLMWSFKASEATWRCPRCRHFQPASRKALEHGLCQPCQTDTLQWRDGKAYPQKASWKSNTSLP